MRNSHLLAGEELQLTFSWKHFSFNSTRTLHGKLNAKLIFAGSLFLNLIVNMLCDNYMSQKIKNINISQCEYCQWFSV